MVFRKRRQGPHLHRQEPTTPLVIEGLERRFALSAAPLTPALEPADPALEAAAMIALRPPLDLNGDAIVDAVWRNATTGINVGWIYDAGGAVTSTRVLGGDATWRLETCGDYEGNLKTDVVWRSAATGGNVMWLMDGPNATSTRFIGGDALWRLETTAADFDANADGMTDLVWRQTAGASVLWRMNGLNELSATVLPSALSSRIAGTGDFNGDGRHDIPWRESTGGTVLRLMNSFTVLDAVVIGGDTTWSLIRWPGPHPT